MKTKELHSMKAEELKSKKIELQKELMKFNAQVAVGTTPKQPTLLKSIKKNIARINTELIKKEKS
jgi:ribosomal protein L29